MMMRRSVWLTGLAAVAVGVGVFFMVRRNGEDKSRVVAPPPPMVSASLNELPSLAVNFGDQSSIDIRDLSGNIILVFFNPECDHCHQEAEQIAAEKSAFDGWQVYFIASVDAKASEEFGVKYRLTESNFHFGSAGVNEVFNAVGTLNEVPTIIVYKNQRFAKKFEGVTSVADIKQVLGP